MANKKYEETDIQAIAVAIKEKTGSEEPLYVRDMASGVGEVFEGGKQAEYDEFWDAFQNQGNRTNYKYAFYGEGWSEKTFFPKYPITSVTDSSAMFYRSLFSDLRQHCIDNNITIDLTKATSIESAFYLSTIQHLPDSIGEIANVTNCQRAFYNCYKLKTLPKMKSSNVTNFFRMLDGCYELEAIEEIDFSSATNLGNSFYYCNVLTEIGIIGEIPISISFSQSPLSIASLKSIIKHLKNYCGTENEFTYTLTVKASAWEALKDAGFDDEDYTWMEENFGATKEDITNYGLTWLDAITEPRWNLTLAS